MPTAHSVLATNDDFPIRTHKPVHSGKVRSVYWLTPEDSARLISQRGYDIPEDSELAVMIISDRLSAFDCIWTAEGGVKGVPGKGAALNSISAHWFKLFREQGLADSHILEVPHPLIWIVQKAKPVMIEAIARNYITGSMWRAYASGERDFCGIKLDEGLAKDQKLDKLIITPSTKGILKGIENVPEVDDVNITRNDLESNYEAFGFNSVDDITLYETLLVEGFRLIEEQLSAIGQIFVDTKFEFGYVFDTNGQKKLVYMDEVGTPDSSRLWDRDEYQKAQIVENSKEGFRKALLEYVPDADVLLNKSRMEERINLAAKAELPLKMIMDVSDTYIRIAEQVTGEKLLISDNPRAEILDILDLKLGLIA